MREKIVAHEGWSQHIIRVKTGKEQSLFLVEKGAPVSLRWRPVPGDFRFLEAVGIVAGVRYVRPSGSPEVQKLLDVQEKRRLISIDEDAITKLIPIDSVLRRTFG